MAVADGNPRLVANVPTYQGILAGLILENIPRIEALHFKRILLVFPNIFFYIGDILSLDACPPLSLPNRLVLVRKQEVAALQRFASNNLM